MDGKVVLVRADLNVPLEQGRVANDARIKASLPTLQLLLDGGAAEVRVCSHLGRPTSLEDVARNLNMSARTLRRKLREENTSFRQLVDELRQDFALRYLRDTDLTVEDIAETLGFSDAANFRHAFRRWTNASPHEFRNASRA